MEERGLEDVQSPLEGGNVLRRYRDASRLTQHELARAIDGSRSMIAQLERGERQPSEQMLVSLAAALQLGRSETLHFFFSFRRVPPGYTIRETLLYCVGVDASLHRDQQETLMQVISHVYEDCERHQ